MASLVAFGSAFLGFVVGSIPIVVGFDVSRFQAVVYEFVTHPVGKDALPDLGSEFPLA